MGVKEGVPAGGLLCSCQHEWLLLADSAHMPSGLLQYLRMALLLQRIWFILHRLLALFWQMCSADIQCAHAEACR